MHHLKYYLPRNVICPVPVTWSSRRQEMSNAPQLCPIITHDDAQFHHSEHEGTSSCSLSVRLITDGDLAWEGVGLSSLHIV